jgi:hypothetical protein
MSVLFHWRNAASNSNRHSSPRSVGNFSDTCLTRVACAKLCGDHAQSTSTYGVTTNGQCHRHWRNIWGHFIDKCNCFMAWFWKQCLISTGFRFILVSLDESFWLNSTARISFVTSILLLSAYILFLEVVQFFCDISLLLSVPVLTSFHAWNMIYSIVTHIITCHWCKMANTASGTWTEAMYIWSTFNDAFPVTRTL